MIKPKTEKKLVWDLETNQLVQRIEVFVQIIGTQGTVFDEEGPLLVKSGQEIFEAVMLLKERLLHRIADQAKLNI